MAVDIEEGRMDDLATAPMFDNPNTNNNANANQSANVGGNFRNNGAKAPNLMDIFQRMGSVRSFSAEGAEYIKKLREEFDNAAKNADYSLKVDFITLSTPKDTLVLMNGNDAVILTFEESNPGTSDQPTSHLDREAMNELLRTHPDAQLVKFLIVTKEDYAKYAVMAKTIQSYFLCRNNALDINQVNLDSLGKCNFSYSMSQEDFDRAQQVLNPHGVPLRHDGVITIYMSNKPINQNNYNRTEEEIYYGRSGDDQRTPIATISWYTKFIKKSMDENRYYPVIVLSEINTLLNSAVMLPLWISLGITKALIEDNWWKLYTRISGKINIGNLIPFVDPSGDKNAPTRWVCKNDEDLRKLRTEYLEKPTIVLGVTEGRASPLGVEEFTTGLEDSIIGNISRFLRNPIQLTPADQLINAAPFYRGVFPYGDKVMDSEYIEFLSEYARCPSNAVNLEQKLCYERSMPSIKAAELREIQPEIRWLYRTDTVVLPPNLMLALCRQLGSMNFGGYQQMSNLFDTSIYGASAKQWQDSQMNNAAGYSGFTPYSQWW